MKTLSTMADYSGARARMSKNIALWAAVVLLVVGPAATPAQVQPPGEHYQAARAALMEGNTDKARLEVKIAILARPHLTALSGTTATFIAGADVVFTVSGLNSGDIKPYPVGTTLRVTPTLLRSQGEDNRPQVRLKVEAGRKSLLPSVTLPGSTSNAAVFDDIQVTSEAVLGLDQTLILSGLSQRENQVRDAGVPGLMNVPIIKYLFQRRQPS